jgi:excisionase family DNA binding protein
MTTLAERLKGYDRPLTVDELCYELTVSPETIYDWIRRKRLDAYRVGKSWRFEPRNVLEWWQKRHVGG